MAPLVLGGVKVSWRTVLTVGDTRLAAQVGRLATSGIAKDEGALEFCSGEAAGETVCSRPPKADRGTEASRVEAGAEMLSGPVVRAVVIGVAELVEAAGAVEKRGGQEQEANPVKESRLREPSHSVAPKSDKRLVFVTSANQ